MHVTSNNISHFEEAWRERALSTARKKTTTTNTTQLIHRQQRVKSNQQTRSFDIPGSAEPRGG